MGDVPRIFVTANGVIAINVINTQLPKLTKSKLFKHG